MAKESSSGFSTRVTSRLDAIAEEREMDEFLDFVTKSPIKQKMCCDIPLKNSEMLSFVNLVTKESKSFLSFFKKIPVYTNHPLISVIYIPGVLNDAPGVLDVALVNPITRDRREILCNWPLSKAVLVMTNWTRSIAKGAELNLAYEVSNTQVKLDQQIGRFRILWADVPSSKQIYEKERPPMIVDLEETGCTMHQYSDQTLLRFVNATMVSEVRKPREDRKLLRLKSLRTGFEIEPAQDDEADEGKKRPIIVPSAPEELHRPFVIEGEGVIGGPIMTVIEFEDIAWHLGDQ
uniref:Movement protein n=1 Tax=Ilarvirus APLPV TaxID=134632 RepID=A7KNP5_9BROM|nr:movement protein [American plum line pattern virus]